MIPLRARLRQSLADFGQWWFGQLRDTIPVHWLDRLRSSLPYAVIRLLAARVEIELVDGDVHRLLIDEAPISRLDPESWTVIGENVLSRRTTLLLSGSDCFAVELPLVRASMGYARRMVDLQIERLAPLDPEALVWNSLVVAGQHGQPVALIAMVKRTTLTSLDQLFADHGVPLPTIAAQTDYGALEIQRGHDGSWTRARQFDRKLYWAAIVLLLSIPITTLAGLAIAKADSAAHIAALEDEVGPQLRAAARDRRAAAEALGVRPLLAHPALTGILSKFALALPDDARLQELTLANDGRLRATIEGSDAATVQARLLDQFAAVDVIDGPTVTAANDPNELTAPAALAGPVRSALHFEIRP